jgi:MoxR-like ATPase
MFELNMSKPSDRGIRRALVFETAFHDADKLIENIQAAMLPPGQLNAIGALIQDTVRSSKTIEDYVLDLWEASETPGRLGIQLDGVDMNRLILAGASPRGMSALMRAARVVAWLSGRTHLEPDDVRAVLPSVLGHRVFFTPIYELRRAELAGALVEKIIDTVAAP